MGLSLILIALALIVSSSTGFVVQVQLPHNAVINKKTQLSAASSSPRTGILQSLLNIALDSPLWTYVLVPQARQKMVNTATENGIPWIECREWLKSQDGPWRKDPSSLEDNLYVNVPSYYKRPFHAYEDGNLCWQAAFEAEIASAAVGSRNFPAYGRNGEAAFRDSFQAALVEAGAICPKDALMVDLGCGTGMSTRRLATNYPQASKIVGLDFSPYYCQVGTTLLELAPSSIEEGGEWVSNIQKDKRISYQVGDAADTGLQDNSVDVVNLQFVAHELPHEITLSIIREAHRILKDGGQLWFCEMDFEAPAYAAQRDNPLLFALIRATEPYLDEYADHAQEIRDCLKENFGRTIIIPATGRHFSIVATKQTMADYTNSLLDRRFDEHGVYKVEDTHLKVWENK